MHEDTTVCFACAVDEVDALIEASGHVGGRLGLVLDGAAHVREVRGALKAVGHVFGDVEDVGHLMK
eukprot:scaffold69117_cov67-Phaeocystis_antarctica.AAC.3